MVVTLAVVAVCPGVPIRCVCGDASHCTVLLAVNVDCVDTSQTRPTYFVFYSHDRTRNRRVGWRLIVVLVKIWNIEMMMKKQMCR